MEYWSVERAAVQGLLVHYSITPLLHPSTVHS
jgi:hypothetical protein